MANMKKISKNRALLGLENIRFEAGHTYEEMAKEIGCSQQMMSKMARGERSLKEHWVIAICAQYSKILGRRVTASEVKNEEKTLPVFALDSIHLSLPEESGPLPTYAYNLIIRYDLKDMDQIIRPGSYLSLDDDTTLVDEGIYVIRNEGRNVVRRYRTGGNMPRFESDPMMDLTEQLFLATAPINVLKRVTAITRIL